MTGIIEWTSSGLVARERPESPVLVKNLRGRPELPPALPPNKANGDRQARCVGLNLTPKE